MPVIVKAPPPMKPVDLAPAPPPAPAGLTRAEVEAMLAARDAAWERRLAALAVALAPKPAPPPPPRKGANITFTTDLRGQITGAAIVPRD